MAIPALALWFLIAMVQRHYVTAAFWFVLCLLVREDAGLHMFALLALWGGTLLLQGRRASEDFRPICRFAAAALGYGALAFLGKHLFFPSGDVLMRAYLGTPILGRVTATFVLGRLNY